MVRSPSQDASQRSCQKRFFYNLNGLDHRNAGAEFLKQLNTRLLTTQHLCGSHFNLADAAIAPFVRQFAHTNPTWFAKQTWSALQLWLGAFETSKAFRQVMQKYTPWAAGQPPVLFPEYEIPIS
jgi:glutathione S-transferase